jgi:hypothetical protein
MNSLIKWRPPFNKWYKIDKEAYKIIFEQAQKRFEDVMGESESVTDKSIKMISILSGILGVLIGVYFNQKVTHIPFWLKGGIILLAAAEAFLLFNLIAPKQNRNRGMTPEFSIPKDLDNDEDQKMQAELVYFQSIILLQDNIDFMIEKNKKRAQCYKLALVIFLILFSTTIAATVILF